MKPFRFEQPTRPGPATGSNSSYSSGSNSSGGQQPLSPLPTTRPLGQFGSGAPRRRPWLPTIIVGLALVASLVVLLVSGGLNLLPFAHSSGTKSQPAGAGATSDVIGHVFFLSSGQVNVSTSQGIADQVQVDLSKVPPPAPGKAYYAWLQSDNSVESQSILLGKLALSQGTAQLFYKGDPQHTNLLAIASRFLVTEEDAATTPTVPSLDRSTWRYLAVIPNTPDPQDSEHHYSLLDHLRHLLALDPTLQKLGLPGGLDIWLFRNGQKILEWAGAARDDWNHGSTDLMHRQFIRILDYLDGIEFLGNDVPAGSPVLVDPHIGRVGLLQFDANQQPPGYLHHIGIHLEGVVQSPGSTREQQELAQQITEALNKVQSLYQQIRQDAIQLVHMSSSQLRQPAALALLDTLVKQAQDAFVGQFDPQTGELQDGVTQIHYAIERLATLDVTPLNNSSSATQQ
ncbi:MAG: hypothetical protein IMW90_15695 [Thermogemmatispora sp.]|uniref:hypothetical protein n=1 Tax=Thermogemmatispora sp. TaxID=1968838 RepID=UPI0019F376C2|nr:hypothetical protein [Thermogemmatispora sp.]MBE3567161.1 hypothetical protein [Thermogemmatispora sp.]